MTSNVAAIEGVVEGGGSLKLMRLLFVNLYKLVIKLSQVSNLWSFRPLVLHKNAEFNSEQE